MGPGSCSVPYLILTVREGLEVSRLGVSACTRAKLRFSNRWSPSDSEFLRGGVRLGLGARAARASPFFDVHHATATP